MSVCGMAIADSDLIPTSHIYNLIFIRNITMFGCNVTGCQPLMESQCLKPITESLEKPITESLREETRRNISWLFRIKLIYKTANLTCPNLIHQQRYFRLCPGKSLGIKTGDRKYFIPNAWYYHVSHHIAQSLSRWALMPDITAQYLIRRVARSRKVLSLHDRCFEIWQASLQHYRILLCEPV